MECDSALSWDGIVRQAIGGNDRSGLRRLGVLDSKSGGYRLACRGQHRYIQITVFAI
ncbi:hypothetical protein Bca4012_066036 [Brassica carinata]|uniref:Uncharacterized protein n=1 Tax=Brassica carinata TaxID=52824 RepID=A0A8X8AYH8_BRACI|nr:hypothetical protein Bca52824_018355 [Brassica carinata]